MFAIDLTLEPAEYLRQCGITELMTAHLNAFTF